MKNKFLALIIAVTLCLPSLTYGFVPFAPIAEIPASPGNDPLLKQAIKHISAATILENDEVGLPAYPDAQIVQTDTNPDQGLPSVRLISTDHIEQIVAFYKSHLPEWKYKNTENSHLFRFEALRAAPVNLSPAINITKAHLFKVIGSTQTEIVIWYTP